MNTVHSMVLSSHEHNDGENGWRAAPERQSPSLSPEVNRMLSAAVVNAAFRRLLLSDPVAALAGGYSGESFELRADELAQIVMIRASSIAEFAGELLDRLWYGRGEAKPGPVQRQRDRTGHLSVPAEAPVSIHVGSEPAPLSALSRR